jgi:hypothetical protein
MDVAKGRPDLTYSQYCGLLQAAATQYDQTNNHNPHSRFKKQLFYLAITRFEANINSNEINESSSDESYALFHTYVMLRNVVNTFRLETHRVHETGTGNTNQPNFLPREDWKTYVVNSLFLHHQRMEKLI